MEIKVDGIILAAGYSSRTGVFKMELRLGDKALLQYTIEAMMNLCSRVIVVAGYQSERIFHLTKDYANVKVVLNPQYTKGMFTSIKEGVKQVTAEWFFLTPGDYPLITESLYQKLLEAVFASPGSVFIPVYSGRKGHPILVKSDLVKDILQYPEESDLRTVIRRRGFVPVQVDDDSILLDIDTMEDYQRAKARLKNFNQLGDSDGDGGDTHQDADQPLDR